MATYFDRIRAGMRLAKQLLLEVIPDADCEWGPMDSAGNYPFLLIRGGRKTLLYRFSKDSLVALSDEPHHGKLRELFRESVLEVARQRQPPQLSVRTASPSQR
jgi:hypothetical protein